MMELLEFWNAWVSGGVVPLALAASGGYFLIALRKVWMHPGRLFRRMSESLRRGGNSPMRAMSLSLAGVLGVGNLVGVANAIAYGGAGAIFWMWVSATLAMLLKYAEVVLAIRHRRIEEGKQSGCAMYYMEDCFLNFGRKRTGRLVGGVFATLLLLDAVCMGGMIQVNAISSTFHARLHIPPLATGISLAVLLGVIGWRGTHRISRLAEKIVPWMTVGFCLLAIAGMARRADQIPLVLRRIVSEGLSVGSGRGLLGGIGAFFSSRALRYGTMRGLLSNEAGGGTSPMAHADAQTDDPVAQGGMGILEVFVDTHLLCSMTALIILLAFPQTLPQASPMVMTVLAFETLLGSGAGLFLCGAVLCFGGATVLCWSHYMQRTGAYLFPNTPMRSARGFAWLRDTIFLLIYCIFVCMGASFAPMLVWQLSDFAIGSMTLINLCVLWRCRREICGASRA